MGDNRESNANKGLKNKGLIILLAVGLILATVLLILQFRGKDEGTGSGSGGDGGLTVVTTEQSAGTTEGGTEALSPEKTEEATAENTEEITAEKTEEITSEKTEEITSEKTEEPKVKKYKFRSKKLRDQHYEKHGKDMGFDTAEAYVSAANDVISDPSSLYKIEKEDGDDVYYRERDNAFVVVSKDGYLRTFFYPDRGKKYFDSQ